MSIKLENVTKIYENSKHPVIENLDLEIQDGSFTVLLGPSGCGKTTILRMIAGLEKVNEGKIVLDERDITKTPPGERELAMVFQNYAIYPHMSVRGNIEFGLKNYKMSKEQIANRVRGVLELTGLTEFAERKPNQLSGGQRQRVALARALSKSPKVFLMDEPLSNLDAKLRTQMRSEMISLYNTVHKTFIYVTHDQTEALTMGTDIVILRKGKIMQQGSPEEVYSNPANVFVAQFIGDPGMNVIRLEDGSYIGFKPRSISLSPVGEDDLHISGAVDTCEYMGNDFLYHFRTSVGKITCRCGERRALGEQVELYVAKQDLFYFDQDGNRTMSESQAALCEVYYNDD